MVDIVHWSLASATAASNLAVQGVSMAEGMLPSAVNNNMRAGWAIIRGMGDDLGGAGTVGGTANAITVTSTVPCTALRSALLVAFKNSSGPNTAATTFNLDSLGAKAIRLEGDIALVGGELLDDGVYLLRYDTAYNAAAGAWIVLNPSNYRGTATNDSAATGQLGEHVSAALASGSAVSLTTNTAADVTSISLTAGDWDVQGQVAFTAAGTTSVTLAAGYITTASATNPGVNNAGGYARYSGAANVALSPLFALSRFRVSISGTTTIYLGAVATFTVSTMTAHGFISARRVR